MLARCLVASYTSLRVALIAADAVAGCQSSGIYPASTERLAAEFAGGALLGQSLGHLLGTTWRLPDYS
jgi:hypothetical protein